MCVHFFSMAAAVNESKAVQMINTLMSELSDCNKNDTNRMNSDVQDSSNDSTTILWLFSVETRLGIATKFDRHVRIMQCQKEIVYESPFKVQSILPERFALLWDGIYHSENPTWILQERTTGDPWEQEVEIVTRYNNLISELQQAKDRNAKAIAEYEQNIEKGVVQDFDGLHIRLLFQEKVRIRQELEKVLNENVIRNEN